MIYINGTKEQNIVNTAINYNTKYNLNLNELCVVMGITKEYLQTCFINNKNLLESTLYKQVEKILDSVVEDIDKKKTLVASIDYGKEIKLIKDFSSLAKNTNSENYKLTEADYETILKYKAKYRLTNTELSKILDVNRSYLAKKLNSIDSLQELKSINEENRNNGIKRATRNK